MNTISLIYIIFSFWFSLLLIIDKPNIILYALLFSMSVLILEPIRKRKKNEDEEYRKFKESMRRN